MNTSKDSFHDINPGDRVTFRLRDGRIAAANVNPLLIFDTHVVVNRGTCGTVVDPVNYIGHKTPKSKH